MGLQKQISQQYLRRNLVTVTILDTLSPVHFIVKEAPSLDGSTEAKSFIEAEEAMQKFYESVQSCFTRLPLKDTIIVVYHDNKFYRARVIRILTLSSGYLFKVYLVDYGVECSVPREHVYEIEKDFSSHPFQAVNFKLLGIEPVSLIMNSVDLTMSYGPVSYWDPSADIFVQDLQKGMCNTYIEIQGLDEEHIYGKLFISYENNITKCLNDELVSNNFARFNEDCWENVQKIGSHRGNTNAQTKVCRTVEPLNCQESSPEQVSTSSDIEQVFKVTFVNPKDGKVVAESFLNETSASENEEKDDEEDDDNSQELPVPSSKVSSPLIPNITSEKQLHVPDSKTALSSTSDSISEEQSILQKRFLKLRQLRRKQLQSPTSTDDSAKVIVKDLPAVTENNVNKENSSANIFTVEIKQSELSGSVKTDNIHRNSVSPCKSNVSNDCDNFNSIGNKSDNIDCINQVTSNSTSSPGASEIQTVGQQKLLKLRKLRRKQLQSPVCPSNTENASIKQLSSVESAVKQEQSPDIVYMEKADKSSSQVQENHNNNDSIGELNQLNISHDCNNNSNSSAKSKISVSPKSDNNLKQDSMTEDELIAHRRFQKLQQLHRKKRQSLTSPVSANSPDTKSPSIGTKVTDFVTKSPEKEDDNTQALVCSTVNVSLSKSPETRDYEKEVNRAILSNELSEKNNSNDTASKSNLSSNNPEISHSSISKKCDEIPSEDAKKQENAPEVLENVRTLQKLRDRIKMRKNKFPQVSDEPKNSSNVDQLLCSSSIKSPAEMILF